MGYKQDNELLSIHAWLLLLHSVASYRLKNACYVARMAACQQMVT